MMKFLYQECIRILKAFHHSWNGLKAAWKHEPAFRIECVVAFFLIPIVFFLNVSALERLLLIISILLVFLVELINSAIESTIDRIGHERHELSGRAKDLGSSAVMVALILAACVWGTVLVSLF